MAERSRGRKLVRETALHTQAYADYLALGPGRTLAKLHARYAAMEHPPVSPSPSGLTTLKNWSRSFDWQGRVERESAHGLAKVEKAAGDARLSILATGYALQHERVATLNRLAGALFADLFDAAGQPALYSVETLVGKDGTEIHRRIFKKPQVEQLRGLLDDLAKETGGRQKSVSLHATHDGDVTVHHVSEEDRVAHAAAVFGVLAELGIRLPGLDAPAGEIIDATAKTVEH